MTIEERIRRAIESIGSRDFASTMIVMDSISCVDFPVTEKKPKTASKPKFFRRKSK